jgi:methionine synthase II (cobalamin-independent)
VPEVESVRWPDGSATGVGSLPGTSVREAVQLVVDTLPDLPHLPELPARGPGADMVGRTLGLLTDFPADWGPTGWALTDRPGHEIRRAPAFLGEDLDVVEELLEGWAGPFKVQLCGPWTLAASVELRSGRKLLADRGAVRDLHQAYAAGLAAHVAQVAKRLPLARLLVQLDEPALPHVLDGEVPTPSGLTRLAAVDQQVVLTALAEATTAAGVSTGVHCCAAAPPLRLLRQLRDARSGASGAGSAGRPGLDFASVDADLLTERDDDALGEAVESGLALFLGHDTLRRPDATAVAAGLRARWRRLGLAPELLLGMVVTPSCGLAGAGSPQAARAALVACVDAGGQIRDDPEGAA